jgi:hypothetical protein
VILLRHDLAQKNFRVADSSASDWSELLCGGNVLVSSN